MPVRDNRILVNDADTVTGWDDLGGTAAGTQDTEVFREGTASVSEYAGTTRNGMLFDLGSAQDFSDNVFYMWFNTGVAGQLNDINAGGITMRFCGATITDWFEIYLDGADTYSGGWKMYVVDIELARAIATGSSSPTRGGTNGTAPATSAIRWVGITTQTATMTRMVDNMWIDAIWRLPVGEPGVIISGDNGGSPWTWDDVLFELDPNDPAKANGVIREDSGVLFINTPYQFGANGSPSDDHDFEDSNKVLAWESQPVRDNFYGFEIVGDGVNTQRFVAGVNGSAGQGWTVLAAPDGPRWFVEATDPDIEIAGFYGCSFTHTGIIDIDNPLVDMFDTLLIDGQRLYHSRDASPRSGADFRRNAIIRAAPIYEEGSPLAIVSPANRAYLWTADPDKIIDSTFNWDDGDHAMRIDATGPFTFSGNDFTLGWEAGGSPDTQQTLDAAILAMQGGLILNIAGGGTTPTVFDVGSPETEINNNVSVTITNIQPGSEVRVYPSQNFNSPVDLTEIAGTENTGSPSEFTFSAPAGTIVDIVVFNIDYVLPPANRIRDFVIPTTDTSFPITQIIDRNFSNP